MKQKHVDYKVVPYPKFRRFEAVMLRSIQRKPMMHGLLEVDVTRAHAFLREHKAKTGESLSFTAFIIACLGKAVDENKAVQAYRKGRNQLILFDDVDVNTQIERDVAGQKPAIPYTVRAANRKTYREIHHEIRAAQVENVVKGFKAFQFLPTFLFRIGWWVLWRMRERYPKAWKKYMGTVTITAVGMFGKGAGWGIPLAGQTLMITLGGIGEKPGVVDGQLAMREYLSLTISFDHDVIDGAPAARFTQRLKDLIESGYGLIDQEASPALNEGERMKQKHANYKLVPFPKIRRAYMDVLREGQRKHIIHGLLEVDVTKARQFLWEHKAKTGESLSFTAFIIACLAKAVDENKAVQAYRKGRKKLILFKDVDVNTQIEREMGDYKVVMPCVIRAANTKTFREIHQEIRLAQAPEKELARKFKTLQRLVFFLVSLPAFVRGFFWRAVRKHPGLLKRGGGTVAMTSIGMFAKSAGWWGIPIADQTLMITLGGIGEKPGVVEGQLVIREYLSLTISFDHDIIDGAPAARFTQRLKDLIESGYGLIDQEASSALNERRTQPQEV